MDSTGFLGPADCLSDTGVQRRRVRKVDRGAVRANEDASDRQRVPHMYDDGNCVVMMDRQRQPMIRRANASTTNATYTRPGHVETWPGWRSARTAKPTPDQFGCRATRVTCPYEGIRESSG